MKKLRITIIALVISASCWSQQEIVKEVQIKEVEKDNTNFYLSTGLSIGTNSSSDFAELSYVSLEAGYTISNLSFGAVVGRGNIADFNKDNIENYWYEGKVALSQTAGIYSPYVLFGLGNYIDQDHVFIEYGFGTSVKISNLSFYLQASSWDTDWYITPGITYNFD